MTETHAEKAQRLVDEGKVNIIRHWCGAIHAEVGKEHDKHFTYLYDNDVFNCTCEKARGNRYTHDLCEHALAVKLTIEKED